MTPTTATSSLVASLGAGSGIDFAALATSLAEAQFAPRADRLSAQAETVDRQISAASTLRSQLVQLAASIGERVRSGDLSAQPAIADAAIASVSRGSVLPRASSYTLEVAALASAQTLTSRPYAAASTPVGAGMLTVRFGTLSGGSFAEDPARAPATITIGSGATLADAAAAINAANAGISAYVANGADGAHLMLKGKDGAANGFVIDAAETAGEPGLAALAFDPARDGERLLAAAADAAFTLDGLAMRAPSNTIGDAAPGLSLVLTGLSRGAPTTIRFSDPGSAVAGFMQDLTAALNELAGELNKDVDARSGDLARDSGARALRRSLSQLAGTAVIPGAAPGVPATLADLGLATNRDGTFRFDADRLAASRKASPEGVAAMLTNGLFGIFATVDRLARTSTAASDPGSIAGSLARLAARKTALAADQTRLAEAQDKLRGQFVARFAGADSRISTSRSTLSFLQNQIAAWNAAKN